LFTENITKKVRYLFFSLRPQQWIKNLFIFLPLIFGKKLFVFPVNLKVLAAFFLFSLSAGAAYLINDVIDFEKDKLHPIKQTRPVASGKLSIKNILIAACFLGILSVAFSFILNISFGWVVIVYLVFNLIYTKILKEIPIIDVFCLGFFFFLRILAGGVIAQVQLSRWIVVMTILLALFLGFNKRRQELKLTEEKANSQRPVLNKYNIYFLNGIITVLTVAMMVVYTFYTFDRRTLHEFAINHLVYSIPFVYYGILRYLYLVYTQGRGEDTTQILLSDRPMQLNLLLWLIVCIVVVYFGL